MKLILNNREIICAINSMARNIEIERSKWERNICIIPILKGGIPTGHQIIDRLLDRQNITIGYLGLSSYHNGTQTTSKVKITYPLDIPDNRLEGTQAWIIDDVFDSGLTMIKAKSILEEKGCLVRTAVLVRKMNPKIQLWENKSDLPDVVGHEYRGNGFLVGFGMGQGEKYRSLHEIHELEPSEIE